MNAGDRSDVEGEIDLAGDSSDQGGTPVVLIDDYPIPFRDVAGHLYLVRIRGGVREDGLWEGWLEFVAAGGTIVLRTGRETTQSSREALVYWAGGLEQAYLDGAFDRACRHTSARAA